MSRSRSTRSVGQAGRRGPPAAAVRGGSRAERSEQGGLAQRAARPARRRRPGARSPWSSGAGARPRRRRTISGSAPPNLSRGPRAAGVDWSAGAILRWWSKPIAVGSSTVCRASEIAAPAVNESLCDPPAKGGRPTRRAARPAWRVTYMRPRGGKATPHCRAHRPGMIERRRHRECPRHRMRRARSPIALRLVAHDHAVGGAGERRRLAAGRGVAVGGRHQTTVDDVGDSPSMAARVAVTASAQRRAPARRGRKSPHDTRRRRVRRGCGVPWRRGGPVRTQYLQAEDAVQSIATERRRRGRSLATDRVFARGVTKDAAGAMTAIRAHAHDPLLSVEQAAEFLGVSAYTVRQ